MSQYKIVGMLERIDEQSMHLAPATTYATTQEAASLIQELGEALTLAQPFLNAGAWRGNPDEVAVKVDAILSKLKEA